MTTPVGIVLAGARHKFQTFLWGGFGALRLPLWIRFTPS